MCSSCGSFLEIYLVNLHFSVNEFINIDDDTKAIDIHEHKTWVHIICDAAVGSGGRSRINDNTTLVFVCLELMGVTTNKDVHI